MNVNPMQLIQMIKGGQNPQQLVMQILQQNNSETIKNDKGQELPIVHFYFDMDQSVRNDIYEYFVEEEYA